MGTARRQVGFWHAVGQLKVRDVFSVETFTACVLGAGLALALYYLGDLDARTDLSGQFLAIVAALVGIVFAGFALVAALMSESYLRLLRSGDAGVLAFFRPFILAIGLQVATILLSVGYGALAKHLPSEVEPWAFGVICVLFFASCLEVVVLCRSIMMHVELRSRLNELTDLEVERERKRRSAGG